MKEKKTRKAFSKNSKDLSKVNINLSNNSKRKYRFSKEKKEEKIRNRNVFFSGD